jgi:hypothetical protein
VLPNPFNDFLTIESLKIAELDRIEIYDVQGSLVLSNIYFSKQETQVSVHLVHLDTGVYILKLFSENSIGVKKIIKLN